MNLAPDSARERQMVPTLFIYCHHTFASGKTTGIERVVQNILRHSGVIAATMGLDCAPVVMIHDQLAVIDTSAITTPDSHQSRPDALSTFPGSAWIDRAQLARSIRWYRVKLQTRASRVLMRRFKSETLRRAVFIAPADYPISRWLRGLGRAIRRPPLPGAPVQHMINFHDDLTGHILLMPEVSWDRRDWHLPRRFQARGGKVVTIVHDLIPILHPDSSYNAANIAHYTAWIDENVVRSDAIIAVSNTIAEELRGYLSHHTPKHLRTPPIGYFHLGSDFDLSKVSASPLLPEIAAIFDPAHHVFVMVGSITPRKNHALALAAFERYWAAGGTARLVFVGYMSLGTADFLKRVRLHPRYGSQLHHLDNINDAQLETIYRECSALIMASSAEGFGLPLVEALQRGVKVLCSDIPLFHEVTAERAEFFSLENPDALAALVADFETRHPPGQPLARVPIQCLSWHQSSQMMLDAMFKLLKSS